MGSLASIEILILLMVTASFILWLWMLIDCANNEPRGSGKIVWLLIILFGSWIGAAIYYSVRRPKRIQETGK
jgi:hypothetical protein